MDPFAITFLALKGIVETEFAPEFLEAQADKLHESLGDQGAVCGIYPTSQRPMAGDANTLETLIDVQVFGQWTKEISPTTHIDPRVISGWVHRFVNAVRRQQATDKGSGLVWYFDVTGIDYPDDPTGNKSRFVAHVRARGNNPTYLETTG